MKLKKLTLLTPVRVFGVGMSSVVMVGVGGVEGIEVRDGLVFVSGEGGVVMLGVGVVATGEVEGELKRKYERKVVEPEG